MSSPGSFLTCCDACHKTFQYKSNMYRHRKNAHGPTTKNVYICDHCEFKFSVKKELIHHLQNDHNMLKAKHKHLIRGIRLKCPKCDVHVKSYELLDEHLSKIHEITIEEEYLEFKNKGEFLKWKVKVEKETHSEYSTIRGLRKMKTHLQREYICHRSYKASLKSTGRKRALKSLDTNNIGSACPSRMIVKIRAKKVEVNFIRVHVGHFAEMIRLRIPSDQRAVIAGKLKDGVTIQHVLDDIRYSSNAENFHRIHFLQKKDIHNIIRDFSIGYITRLHKDDVMSVEMLVN